MRLIDADELKKEVLKWMPSDPCGIEEKEYPFETDIVVSLMMEIEEAPTIESKQGEWIADKACYTLQGLSHIIFKCSECGLQRTYRSKYCPDCGARMKRLNDE